MELTPTPYSVQDIYIGFSDEEGVVAFHGALNVRPRYQREFVYNDVERERVLDTVIKGYPLGVFYWGVTGIPDRYECIDGQQRIISICTFIRGDFPITYNGDVLYYTDLTPDVKNKILSYKLPTYLCDGNDEDKLNWFRTINVASKPLTEQEMRNAIYSGSWTESAKKYFSKKNCPASEYSCFMPGEVIKQDYLQEVLRWVSSAESCTIEKYMSNHRNDFDASALWAYFQDVIDWVDSVFGRDLSGMAKVHWGELYNEFYTDHHVINGSVLSVIDGVTGMYTVKEVRTEVQRLYKDPLVKRKKGVYEYIFSGDIHRVSLRSFPQEIKDIKYREQGGLCGHCLKRFRPEDMVADHIIPWAKGGSTTLENCQLLCVKCNSRKSDKSELLSGYVLCSNCGKAAAEGMHCQFCGTKN